MEKPVSATDPNRRFSKLLRAVREGQSYHRLEEFQEISWQETEASSYADFRGTFHDIRIHSLAKRPIATPIPEVPVPSMLAFT